MYVAMYLKIVYLGNYHNTIITVTGPPPNLLSHVMIQILQRIKSI